MRTAAFLLLGLLVGLASEERADAAQANDLFINRTTLSGMSATVSGNNSRASSESGEDVGGGGINWYYSLWYAWTAPANGVLHLTASTTVQNFYPSIRVYRGATVDTLVVATRLADGGTPVTAGDTVAIQVASIYYPIWGGGGGGGPFTLTLSLELPTSASV